jgi:photosystem II stability/assembly factor-like uncharacterized protein
MNGQLVGISQEAKWVSADAGSTWIRQPIRFPKSAVRGLSVDGNDIWCMTEDAFLAPSTNPGGLDIANYFPNERQKMARMKNRIFIAGDDPALWVYNEPGYSWKKRWTKAELGNATVSALYASDGFLAVALGNGAFRISRDSGLTLVERSPAPGPITSMTGRPEGLFATVSGGVYFTADSGTSWTRQSMPDALVLFGAESALWVGWTVKDSLIFSKDGGKTWEREASPLPPGEAAVLHVHGGAAYLGTQSYGVLKRPLVSAVSITAGPSSHDYPGGRKTPTRRLQGEGWVFGKESETARDLRGRRPKP